MVTIYEVVRETRRISSRNSHGYLRSYRRWKLVLLGSFSHDPGGGLAGSLGFAFVRDELFLDVGVCILSLAYSVGIYRELGVTIFTHAKHRNIVLPLDDPKLTIRRAHSFPHAGAHC